MIKSRNPVSEANKRYGKPMEFDTEASDFEHTAFVEGAVWAQGIYEEELNSWRDGSIIAKLAEAEAAIERVRALHRNGGSSQGRTDEGYGYIKNCCETCGEFGEYGVEWPCPTVVALDMEEEK